MFGFGKKKKAEEAEKAAIDKAVNEEIEETSVEVEELKEEENSAEVIKYDRVNGPHDIEEVSEEDLRGLRQPGRPAHQDARGHEPATRDR